MKINFILLAAGNSRRFGSNKLLYPIDGKAMVDFSLETICTAAEFFRQKGDDVLVIVVVQKEAVGKRAEKQKARYPFIHTIFSPKSFYGINYSISAGIEEAEKQRPGGEWFVFSVADEPDLTWQSVVRLLQSTLMSGKKIGRLWADGVSGNPVVFHRSFLSELKGLQRDQGGKAVMNRHLDQCYDCPAAKEELWDIDRTVDLKKRKGLEKTRQEGERMDLLCVGEMLVDFTPGSEKDSFIFNPGGAPANVAIAAARNGVKVGFIGAMGDDDFGRRLVGTLLENHVEFLGPPLTKEAKTTLAFVTVAEDGERSFTFMREPGADTRLKAEDISVEAIDRAAIIHGGSVSMTERPSRDATIYALKTGLEREKLVSFDVNYREAFWTKEACWAQIKQVLPYVDLLKISQEEAELFGGEEQIFPWMEQFGISVTVETLGRNGARVYFQKKCWDVAGFSVRQVDATGAGDGFWGGFLSSLLQQHVGRKEDLTVNKVEEALRYGNAAGALCVQKKGGIPGMPYREDMIRFLAGGSADDTK
ncbi:MAG: NTP transferase domain-containing protein [Clostridiales bacterium]|nr:NTP transferase domain-containing protein [Clostridiales bacterium]